ncbi:sigma-70 family RNA polymerase sigma factor [Cohnella endophytica]|uniref:Sigma-70 family RNA polymerase sigma factor n=2 Tax=Cohnella endophytica TaxID=2419778 RepID=A0A494XV42_9BACL|nr:sigma-70 family RNA polymerase sigma factor [Cohnella endophytica]
MQNELYGMARSLLNNDNDCADAIQEAILKAYKGITKLREQAYFRTWMFRILIRECQTIYRIKKKVSPMDNLPEQGVATALPDWDLQSAVDRLGEPLRTLVKLHYFADMPLGRIAETMEVSEGTLKSRLHRARRQLAKRLNVSEERGGIDYELR